MAMTTQPGSALWRTNAAATTDGGLAVEYTHSTFTLYSPKVDEVGGGWEKLYNGRLNLKSHPVTNLTNLGRVQSES